MERVKEFVELDYKLGLEECNLKIDNILNLICLTYKLNFGFLSKSSHKRKIIGHN